MFPKNFSIIACTKLEIRRYNILVTAYFAKRLYLNESSCSFYLALYTLGAICITRKISYNSFRYGIISFFSASDKWNR